MHKLSGLDAGFLYNETVRCPQHVASVQVLELPNGVGEGDFIEGLKRMFLSRVHLVPYLTNKLAETPFMADHPVWVTDSDFDIERHIDRVDVPAPGGLAELEAVVAKLHEVRYERNRPLWRLLVLCGLQEGRIAYYFGAHHACLDGMAGQAATEILMDVSVEPREVPPAPEGFFDAQAPTLWDLASASFENVAKFRLRQATRALDAIETGVRLQRRAFDPSAGFGAMAQNAPRTRFNRSIERQRSYVVGDLDLADVKAIGKATGAKLNDVFLAICGGGLRRYLARTGELPSAALIAGCPVSLRKSGDKSMNNQVTMMQVSLATDEADGGRRIDRIKASSAVAKTVTADLAGTFEADPVAWGLPLWMRAMASVLEASRFADSARAPFNVVVSNVPGPRETLYSNGARMLTHYPVSIPAHGMGVNITVQSYTDTLYFGITACAKALPDADALRDDMLAEYAALRAEFLPQIAVGAAHETLPALVEPAIAAG